jgi:hypothetical protein
MLFFPFELGLRKMYTRKRFLIKIKFSNTLGISNTVSWITFSEVCISLFPVLVLMATFVTKFRYIFSLL